MKILLSSFIHLFYSLCLWSQTPMVSIGTNGKLQYTKYANTGQTEAIHQVPDFSWSGYKNGGVKLPLSTNLDTLLPVNGDNTPNIQQAIDAISAMPPDSNGIRGAIFLKAGKYECYSPIFIRTSGVILKGEGQLPAVNDGTQLVAMAKTQHDFINIEGKGATIARETSCLDTIFVPQQKDSIDGKIWLSANVSSAAKSEYEGDRTITLKLEANNGDYSAYDSREGTNSPYLKVLFTFSDARKDTIVILKPSQDAYVRGGEFSSSNFGRETELVIKNAGQGNSVTREFYLKFELPAISAEVKSAELWLWCKNAGNTSVQQNFVSLIANDNWGETTITYNNQPLSVGLNAIIKSAVVPVGSYSFEVDNIGNFKKGDLITVLRTPNQKWIDVLDMAQYGWTADAYEIGYDRTITNIDGNKITVDAPIVQSIETEFGGGKIFKTDYSGKISNCGIENMFISSYYTNTQDENHGWTAVILSNTENCWVKNVTAQYFGYACVELYWANRTTVEECAMLDPMSITTGSRKYSFHIEKGSFNLFQRCYTRGGRHDYVTGSRVAGPNAFVDCFSEQTFADIGPHHRYATGILFDNIKGGEIRVQNRKDMGSGHGWAGAQTMFWNLESVGAELKVESPFGAMNWGIGCAGPVKNGAGYWESWGKQVQPRSLYLKQLEDRLGPGAVSNITSAQQREGNMWEILRVWKGIGSIRSGDAFLKGIGINGIPIPGFDPYKYNYVVQVADTTKIPAVSFVLSDPLASGLKTNAASVPGTSKIEITASNKVTKLNYSVSFTVATGNSEHKTNKFKIYPNPSNNAIWVESLTDNITQHFSVYTINGEKRLEGIIRQIKQKIDLNSLAQGVYILRLENEKNSVEFIKQ